MKPTIFILCFFSLSLRGQRPCGVSEKILEIKHLQTRSLNKRTIAASGSSITGLVRLPVVFHIIHPNVDSLRIGGSGNPNISEEQIRSQVRILNEDFRRQAGTKGFNNSSVGADLEIEFFLAERDPRGILTNGIVRRYNRKTVFDINSGPEDAAEISNWPSDKYLNIWVLPNFQGFLGYAQFPSVEGIDGLGNFFENAPKTDGIFLDYRYVGNIGTATDPAYKDGRTATHEVGHWLGLIHTWGDDFCGDDFCADIPTAEGANRTRNCNPVFSTCSNGQRTQNMIENYMDASADPCVNIFTEDQKKRTRAVLELSPRRRSLLANSVVLTDTPNLQVKVYPNPIIGRTLFFEATFSGTKQIIVELTTMDGKLVLAQQLQNQKSRVFTYPLSSMTKGQYILQLMAGGESATTRVFFQD